MPTTSEIEARPELLMGPNPLIERAAPFIPFDALATRLQRLALEGKNWRAIPPAAREPLLDFSQQHFVPTRLILEPAAGIQRLFRRSLCLRNPMLLQERRRVVEVTTAADVRSIRSLPYLDGAGGYWAGPTGMGKTTMARRVLEVICPEQVIVHDACPAAGWRRLVQCCYLYVDHPSNGSRGALLKRILMQLDSALGTDYYDQYERVSNIDTLLVTVAKLLVAHRVALLVIDEKQSQNFLESPWQLQFVIFYLSLMNLGTSVLLLGNPVAFEHLKSFSQVMRRFSLGGNFDLNPATPEEEWWRTDFVPAMRKFCVVEKISIEDSSLTARVDEACGGLPGLFEAFYTEAQRSALRRRGAQAVLTPPDFDEAERSPRYQKNLQIAASVRLGTGDYADVPDEVTIPSRKVSGPKNRISRPAADVVSSLLGRYKAEQTRLTNSLMRKMRAMEGLSEDDLRMLGATEDMLAQLVSGSPFAKSSAKNPRIRRTSEST